MRTRIRNTWPKQYLDWLNFLMHVDCSGKMSDWSEKRCEVAGKNFLIELKECVNGLRECFALPERMPYLVWSEWGFLNKLHGTEVVSNRQF